MKYLSFENGNKIPVLGLGTWKSATGEIYQVIRKAIEIGYRHFDCAFLYGNENEIGQALSDALSAGDVKREDLFITSKLWNNRHRAEQVENAFYESLYSLRLEYLDLYLIHWPIVLKDEIKFPSESSHLVSLKTTSLSETWSGMIGLQEKRLTKNIGVSNFNIPKIEKITTDTGIKPAMNQVEIHPFLQQNDLKNYCDQNQILLTGFCPLGSSDRPANRKVEGEPKLFDNQIIKKIAVDLACSQAQVMLAWAVQRGTIVIPKSVNPVRMAENLHSADIKLSNEQMSAMATINQNYRYIKGDFWCLEGSDYFVDDLWNH